MTGVTESGVSGVLPTAQAWLCEGACCKGGRATWASSALGRARWVQAGAVVERDPRVAFWAEQELNLKALSTYGHLPGSY